MSRDGNFISRWSQRKRAARTGAPVEEPKEAQPVAPLQDGDRLPAKEEPPLPPVDSLTPQSDFTPFMKADVDPGLKRGAMRVLMRDPRFNVMDGLDVYIDDYSKPDPIPEEWLGQLNMMKRLGSFVEEAEGAEKSASEPAAALQKPMPEQRLQSDAQRIPSVTESDNGPNNDVTESGIAGGKLPRNEA